MIKPSYELIEEIKPDVKKNLANVGYAIANIQESGFVPSVFIKNKLALLNIIDHAYLNNLIFSDNRIRSINNLYNTLSKE